MAIITNTINGMTEISASSGKYLTQSYPTNFHEFYSKKMILPDDSVDNYKEVTETEKTQIETQDAKWEEPSKELIERWDMAWWDAIIKKDYNRFGKYNFSTGFFEGNDVKDINAKEAARIMDIGIIRYPKFINPTFNPSQLYLKGKTILPIYINDGICRGFCASHYIQVIRFVNYYMYINGAHPDTSPINVFDSTFVFYVSPLIREIKGILDLNSDTAEKHFLGSFNYNRLEVLKVINLKKGIDLKTQLNLNIDCVDFMVENAKTVDAGQTITLHPNVYAKVSDELFGKASNKNITIATTTN